MTKKKMPLDPRDYYIKAMPKVSLEQVAKAYKSRSDCGFQNLKTRSAKENWPQMRVEYQQKTSQRALDLASEAAAQLAAKTWHEHNAQCFELAENLKYIGKQLLRQYVEISRTADGTELTKITCNPSEFKMLTSTLLDLCDRQRLYLNIDKGKPVVEPPPLEDIMKPFENDPIIKALTVDIKADWNDA